MGQSTEGGDEEDPGSSPQARTGHARAPRPLPAWAAALRATHGRPAHPRLEGLWPGLGLCVGRVLGAP